MTQPLPTPPTFWWFMSIGRHCSSSALLIILILFLPFTRFPLFLLPLSTVITLSTWEERLGHSRIQWQVASGICVFHSSFVNVAPWTWLPLVNMTSVCSCLLFSPSKLMIYLSMSLISSFSTSWLCLLCYFTHSQFKTRSALKSFFNFDETFFNFYL